MKVIMREIEMIAYFDQEGFPMPIRFRVDNESKEGKSVINIDEITGIEPDRKAGNVMIRYNCVGMVNGWMRPFEIFYEAGKYRWFLFKI